MKMSLIYFLSLMLVSTWSCTPDSDKQSQEPIIPQAVYSQADPGNWAGKEDSHTPAIEMISASGQYNLRVSVSLKDVSPSHYIEKIFIADTSGKPFAEVTFNNATSGVESVTGTAKGRITHAGGRTWTADFAFDSNEKNRKAYAVYARCSQHDLWVAPW